MEKSANSIINDRLDFLSNIKAPAAPKNLSDEKKAEFEKASRGFESMFAHMMMKEMKSAMLEEKSGFDGFGAETLSGYADLLLSDQISKSGSGIGIANMLYKQFTGENLKPITQHVFDDAGKPNPSAKIQEMAVAKDFSMKKPTGESFADKLRERLGAYGDIISDAANKFELPEKLIKAVISAESAGKPDARSSAGAKGLMQLMDGTAEYLGVSNSFDPKQNIMGGSKYLREMINKFGSLDLSLAAYNAGPGAVAKYNGIPPYKETEQYVRKVNQYMSMF